MSGRGRRGRIYGLQICTDQEPEAHWRRPSPDCPNVDEHTLQPVGYLAWQAWAILMLKTHQQRRCPDCGLLHIWDPK